MKNNKRILFATCAAAGGFIGEAISELFGVTNNETIPAVLSIAILFALCGALITVGLFAAAEIYNRRPFSWSVYQKALVIGAIAAAIAGAIAQSVFSLSTEPTVFTLTIFRAFCWGLAGGLLGWRLSSVIPNLGTVRGIIGGGIGGVVGGISFIILSIIFYGISPESDVGAILGRLVGFAILGASLGLAVVIVEELFRAARLDIIWGPKETTSVTLGSRPVYIGGGDDHIFVSGLPQHAIGVVLENGKIQCIENATGKRSDLKDGSRIQIGKVEIVVKTKE